jgi:hypothetical protein
MDVDKRWKTLYFSLGMRGKEAVSELSEHHRLWLKSKGFFKNKRDLLAKTCCLTKQATMRKKKEKAWLR